MPQIPSPAPRPSASNAPCTDDCPVRRTAKIIEGKWTTLVVRDLLSGKKRYSELQRSLTGISPRLLADRLRLLETQGLLTRTVYPTIPPSTEYTLTPRGYQLGGVIAAMAEFGMNLPAAENPDEQVASAKAKT